MRCAMTFRRHVTCIGTAKTGNWAIQGSRTLKKTLQDLPCVVNSGANIGATDWPLPPLLPRLCSRDHHTITTTTLQPRVWPLTHILPKAKLLSSMEHKAFLYQEAPAGYVAGVGRGATGFTTSADTVRFTSNFGNEDNNEEGAGNDDGLLSNLGTLSKDDKEADDIYDDIERRLEQRRKKTPLETSDKSLALVNMETSAIRQQFKTLKSDLGSVSLDAWANLPEVGDLTRRNKRQRILEQQRQRTYAAPDALIASNRAADHEREDKLPSALLADIEAWESENAQFADIEKSRTILASLRKADPKKADAWIASAKLEEQAKQFETARSLIVQGCRMVPSSEEIWVQNIRIHQNLSDFYKKGRAIANEALKFNPMSEKLWLQAFDLESSQDIISRRKVLMKALEHLPSNAELWRKLIGLESEHGEVKPFVLKAVELCPEVWDFWLQLVNITEYNEAKSVLNRARKALSTDIRVWAAALKLEEREIADVSVSKLSAIVKKGLSEIAKKGAAITIDDWFSEASKAEEEGFTKTAEAIVNECLCLIGSHSDVLQRAEDPTHASLAEYIYSFAALSHPHEVKYWVKLFDSAKRRKGGLDRLYGYYKKAIELHSDEAVLHLMYAKDLWVLGDDVDLARKVLVSASIRFPESEKIWLARVKLELRTGKLREALTVSSASLESLSSPSARIFYKHIHLLRFFEKRGIEEVDFERLDAVSKTAVEKFPYDSKVYLQRSQLLVENGHHEQAHEVLVTASKLCSKSTQIWIALANLRAESSVSKSRTVLDKALTRNELDPELWDARIAIEIQAKDLVAARQLINKALKLFPQSATTWMRHLAMIPKMSHRKNAFMDALQSTSNSTEILLGIGVFFWIDGKLAKAKAWFDRALKADSANGDAWGWTYCFLKRLGSDRDVEELQARFSEVYDNVNRGKAYNGINKDPESLDRSPSDILELVSEKLLASVTP